MTRDETAAFEALRATLAGQEVTAMEWTWADRIEAKGREEGLQQGRQEGRQEGLQRGRQEALAGLRRFREVVLRQLAQRFGPVPARVRRRIEALESLEPLERIAGQILTAGSLAEIEIE